MRRPALALGIVALVLAAGCAGTSGPPVDSRTVPEDAPSEAGSGDYNLTLTIRDGPDGEPIENAAVIVYYGDFDSEGQIDVDLEADGRDASATIDGVARVSNPSTPSTDTTLPMRTNADGNVLAQVPENRVIGIVASAPGHTEEWVPQASTGADGGQGTVSFPLYEARLTTSENATWDRAGASEGKARDDDDYAWNPDEVPWGDSAAERRGYIERLANLRVQVTWENTPTQQGDLAAGVGVSESNPDRVADEQTQSAPGEHTEELVADVDDIEEEGWPDSEKLFLGAATGSEYTAPFEFEYTVETTARFDPFANPSVDVSGDTNASPGPAAAIAAIAIAGTALAARTRA